MEQKEVLYYVKWKIDSHEHYQYLPTSDIRDVVYEAGMKVVVPIVYIKDGDYYIELDYDYKSIAIGEKVSSLELLEKNGLLREPLSNLFCKYLRENPNEEWIIYEDKSGGVLYSDLCIKPKVGEIPNTEVPSNIINGTVSWYLELHHQDGSISYEKTLYNDKKYRGQECCYYQFVKVCDYNIGGISKQVVVERENEKHPYFSVEQTYLDDLIDATKKILYNIRYNGGKQEYNGFEGVTPLYAFNTENSACVFFDNSEKIKDSVVTTVTGSGDAILDLFLNGANKIIAFDINPITKFYAELKFIAAKHLNFSEFCELFSSMEEKIFLKVVDFLSYDTRCFWEQLYSYSKSIGVKLRSWEKGGIFYPTNSIFSANGTFGNEKGYYNEENFYKLQEKLQTKSLDDINLVTCDLFNMQSIPNLGISKFVYLSNIMDFIVGIDKNQFDKDGQNKFKYFISNILIPALNNDVTVILGYLKKTWGLSVISLEKYKELYPDFEGFNVVRISDCQDYYIVYRSNILLMNEKCKFPTEYKNDKYVNFSNSSKFR